MKIESRPFQNNQQTNAFMESITNGLPQGAKAKRVVILGAGMAGLVAGKLLKEAGHTVTIIEGNNRIGGRIHTIREPFTQGNYFEAGAMRIPNTHKLTLELIKKFNLTAQPFINTTPNDLIFANNRLIRKYQYDQNPGLLGFPLPLLEEGMTAFELLQFAIQPFYDLYQNSTVSQQNALNQSFDRYSMETYLRENPFGRAISPSAIYSIKALLGIIGFPELSFLDIFFNITGILLDDDIQFYEIKGGNDQLPLSYEPYLKDELFLGSKVERIIQMKNSVDVYSKNMIDSKIEYFTGDVVISTIPFSAFQFVDVEPYDSIPFMKWKVIRTLHYVPATKIGIEFSEKFWEKDAMRGGTLITDLPSQFIYYPSDFIGEPGPGMLLASYSWGDNAKIWDSLPESERIQKALDYLSRVHGDKVKRLFMNGKSFSWGHNQFSAGCFSLYSPYQFDSYPEIIKRPAQRIHFAGEHTSERHGWVEGAVESGIRVAQEVNALEDD